MNRIIRRAAMAAVMGAVFTFASCTSDQEKEAAKTPPAETNTAVAKSAPADVGTSSSTVLMVPGEAGGIEEDTFSATATVTGVEAATRSITLKGEAGNEATFVCGPEVKNFDQLKVGDKVTAEVTERLTVFVRHDDVDPTVTHSAALATAPKGAKPGMMVGQTTEITAKVKSIDTDARKATLEFSGGETRTVNVRADVDMSKYHVGDTVVIRLTEAISILTKAS
jgi:hypothetical protein